MNYWIGSGLLAMLVSMILGMLLNSIDPLRTLAVVIFALIMGAMVIAGVFLACP